MTTTAPVDTTPLPAPSALSAAVGDTLTITRRNLTRLLRVPDSVVFEISSKAARAWHLAPTASLA